MTTIYETCAVCGETREGQDDGATLEGWPDGVFLPDDDNCWVCQDCIPDGYKFKPGIDHVRNLTRLAELEKEDS